MKYLLISLLLASQAYAQSFKVHEWGTFTSLIGSNGVRQDGMFHEDEQLPDFVHNFGEKAIVPFAALTTIPGQGPIPKPIPRPIPRPGCGRNSKVGCDFLAGQIITQKMETPVLYFHSNTHQKVSVEVGFPGGVISQTYPAPVFSLPIAIPGVPLDNGFTRFNVDVLTTKVEVPFVEEKNIYGYARNVKANYIQSGKENEKFIFYRGLGKFETKLLITSHNGNMQINNPSDKKIPAVFLVDTTENGGAILSLGSIVNGGVKQISDKNILSLKAHHQDFASFTTSAKALLVKSLVANGLYTDEALAMVNTWEHGYFKTPGLRVLYVLNRAEVESILPMKMTPAPQELNRVFVGRIEVLLDTEENALLKEILTEREAFNVLGLGRFAHSIILRLEDVARERGLLDAHLGKIFEGYKNTIATEL